MILLQSRKSLILNESHIDNLGNQEQWKTARRTVKELKESRMMLRIEEEVQYKKGRGARRTYVAYNVYHRSCRDTKTLQFRIAFGDKIVCDINRVYRAGFLVHVAPFLCKVNCRTGYHESRLPSFLSGLLFISS